MTLVQSRYNGAPHSAKQIFFNTFAGLASNFGSALAGLIATPLLIARLGVETFGFWAILSAMVNYAGLLDGGLTSTFMKYVADYAAQGQPHRVRQVITFGVFFYAILGLIVAPLAMLAAPLFIHYMHVSASLAREGPGIFGWIALSLFLTGSASAIAAVLSGSGELRIVSGSTFFGRTVFSIVAVALCSFGLGLNGLVIATFAQLGTFAILTYVAARRRLGSLFIAPWRWEPPVILRLFSLGGWIQLTNVCSTIAVESNRFIISAFVSTAAVTYFEVASRLTRAARSVPFNFIVALLPAVSARNAVLEDDDFNATYARASRYVNYVTVLLLGFIMAAGRPISFLWIGTVYPDIGTITILVALAFLFINVTMVGTTMLRAIALAKYETYYYAVWTAASIALMVAFVPHYRLIGVLAGMAGGAALGTAYFLMLFHKLRSLPLWKGFFQWALPLSVIAIVAVGVTSLAAAFLDARFHGRIAALGEVTVLALLYIAVFFGGTIAAHFFDAGDWKVLRPVLPARIARLVQLRHAAVRNASVTGGAGS